MGQLGLSRNDLAARVSFPMQTLTDETGSCSRQRQKPLDGILGARESKCQAKSGRKPTWNVIALTDSLREQEHDDPA